METANMAKWQPIETAPKDGRTLLLGYFNSGGNWRTLRGEWFTEGSMDEWDGDDGANPEGWYETSVENDDPPNCWATEPTHWMPLPDPPDLIPEPCDHRHSELLTYKRTEQGSFEMRKCLECTKIFRVRLGGAVSAGEKHAD
jgi:hypothetical protein